MMKTNDQWSFIVWSKVGRRSQALAAKLGGTLHRIYYFRHEKPLLAPIKYTLQGVQTGFLLLRKRPRIVFVQSPPFVCCLIVYLYCRLFDNRYVIDYHSAAFLPLWNWAGPVQKFLARRAITNIVTNSHWSEKINDWKAPVFILEDPLMNYSEKEKTFIVKPGFSLAVISSFSPDEPLEEVLKAASQLPDIHFYITGDTSNKPADFFEHLPENVIFTGFLPDSDYFALLSAVQAVMVLTTRDYTLQGGGFEALSLSKPLITSDWPYLRRLFPKGTLYVANNSDSIRDGVAAMQIKRDILKKEIETLKYEKQRDWNSRFTNLLNLITDKESKS